MIIIILLVLLNLIFLFFRYCQLVFKVSYYQKRLEQKGINDAVKDMEWWRLYY